VFTCQHGEDECAANMYQACGLNANNGTSATGVPTAWPFVLCMEGTGDDPKTAAEKCAGDNNVDWSVIKACAGELPAVGSSDVGNPLMHSIGAATEGLQPPHQWTPWVVMNGRPLSEKQLDQDLTQVICDAYKGTKPAGCTKTSEKLNYRN